MTTPSAAAGAYASLARLANPSANLGAGGRRGERGPELRRAAQGRRRHRRSTPGARSDAQTQPMAAGKANVVDVVTAVAETEVAVEALVAVRDRMISGLRRNHADADLIERFAVTRERRREKATMTGAEVLDVARDAILTLVLVASPLMLIGLVVGVVISLFQALTQIQEMTLVFVPKILAIFVAMLVALPFMADLLQGHMTRIAARIVAMVKRSASGQSDRQAELAHEDRRLLPARLRRRLHAGVRAHRHHGDAAAGARRDERAAPRAAGAGAGARGGAAAAASQRL